MLQRTLGKTTVARLYAKILTSLGALPGDAFIETTGSRLANDGVPGIKKHIEEIHNAGGGALFLDEAYQLADQHNFGGRQVLDFLLAEMENNVGKIVFILAGYNKEMEKFFEHNPGLPSRVPYTLQFTDYKDDELLWMLQQRIEKRYESKMAIEGGKDGLYMRIVVRRLGRGRDRPGFGNARALQTTYSKIAERQADRLGHERKDGLCPDDFLLTKEDLIGPDPSQAILNSVAWEKLQELTGLTAVKDSIKGMIDRISINYERELNEKTPVATPLNRVFLGNPGTGKTTVAKLYGRVLADLGLLSNGEGKILNVEDRIGIADIFRHSRHQEPCGFHRQCLGAVRKQHKEYFEHDCWESPDHRRSLHALFRQWWGRKSERYVQDCCDRHDCGRSPKRPRRR